MICPSPGLLACPVACTRLKLVTRMVTVISPAAIVELADGAIIKITGGPSILGTVGTGVGLNTGSAVSEVLPELEPGLGTVGLTAGVGEGEAATCLAVGCMGIELVVKLSPPGVV